MSWHVLVVLYIRSTSKTPGVNKNYHFAEVRDHRDTSMLFDLLKNIYPRNRTFE